MNRAQIAGSAGGGCCGVDVFRRGTLTFPVRESGPGDGPVVVLLHGFPQTGRCWDRVVPYLVDAGFRCVVPDQRGYALGARPRGRRGYRVDQLVADVEALAAGAGADRIHLVGHDWGALVAWALAGKRPDLVASLSTLSVPHPGAFVRALMTSRQARASWYIYAFQLPLVPEWFLRRGGGARLARVLRGAGQARGLAQRDAEEMLTSGALTAALNWYRAIPLTDPRRRVPKTTVPTMFVWSDRDSAVLRSAAELCGRYVTGPYRFEVLPGVSHWLPEAAAQTVAHLLLEQFATYPIRRG
jgi:pimeloyl-ACP methyl ester carboxylesterase